MTTQLTGSDRHSARPQSTLKTIVVATDFSSSAAAALAWAVELAKAHGARIIVAHAIDAVSPEGAKAHSPLAREVGQRLDLIQASIKAGKVEARCACEPGKPWDVISRIAREEQADLIVAGAHGQSRLTERVLGTVADRLIKSSSLPVLVHRESMTSRAVRTVLVATDFSEEAALATSAAVRLLGASPGPARLVLLHTVALFVNYGDLNTALATPEYWDESEQAAGRQLETLAAPLRSDRLEVEVKTVRGYAPEAILREAERIGADLIAIGTVGRSGLNRFLTGSVARHVLHHATCPVLTVRRPARSEPARLSAE